MADSEIRLLETLEQSLGSERKSKKKQNIFESLKDNEAILLYSQIKKPNFGEKTSKYLFMGVYPNKKEGSILNEVGLFDYESNEKEKLSIDEVKDIFGIMLYEEVSVILEAESNGENLFLTVNAII